MDIVENLAEWSDTFEQNWLAHYQATGETNWAIYNRAKNEQTPAGKGINLAESKLMLISSAGGYLHDSQASFAAENDLGDYTLRLIPTHTPFTDISFAHTHYDHTAVNTDPQVLLPLRHLENMAAAGQIGSLASHVISYMGYQPDIRRTVHDLIPAIVETALAAKIDGALLVPA
ncbi:MAG: hypothetical protein H6658_00755 [Ardenticatenaceae bacterium]|nr:hypothetical protein [Ardenticatenaceae bacterium]